jgi:hypothetical protein
MTLNGELFPLPLSVPHTSGKESLSLPNGELLPTPLASDGSGGGQHPDKRAGHSQQLIDYVLLFKDEPLLPTPKASISGPDYARAGRSASGGDDLITLVAKLATGQQWGRYAAAIRRWEQIVGPAPVPTELSFKGNPRLNPAFSQWMMGWPDGWVTDFIHHKPRTKCPKDRISRADALRLIGNGVVSLQAELALLQLLA